MAARPILRSTPGASRPSLGALTRHYFNLRHRGLNTWPILGVAAAGIVALALLLR